MHTKVFKLGAIYEKDLHLYRCTCNKSDEIHKHGDVVSRWL